MTGADQLHAREAPEIARSEGVTMTVHRLTTHDGAKVDGLLRRVAGSRTVVAFMHPRTDQRHHAAAELMTGRGFSVWTQTSRTPNNDLRLLHEEALLDYARGQEFLREECGFETVVSFGHSGGATLAALYHQQAGLPPDSRLTQTPTGTRVPLDSATMPVPDLAIFLAAHPGQGQVLLRCIDPSVADELDPLAVQPELDLYAEANGFAPPPQSSSYSAEFLDHYAEGQRRRVARLDERAYGLVEAARDHKKRWTSTGAAGERRASLAPRLLTIYRTDADPHSVDLGLDPNERPYGSLFGSRPDLTNFGLVGFARVLSAEAWLSTWSANVTRADFVACVAAITAPTLFLEFDGDVTCLPSDADRMTAAVGSTDVVRRRVRGTHFGGPNIDGVPTGYVNAVREAATWIDAKLGMD